MTWEKVGVIGVDAGLCWIGDPCYIIAKEPSELPAELRKWDAFCDAFYGDSMSGPPARQFEFNKGNPGIGVAVSTGDGDGCYPVEVRKTKSGRVAEVRVVFIAEGEEE